MQIQPSYLATNLSMQTELIKTTLDQFVSDNHIPGYNCLISQKGKSTSYIESGKMDVAAGKDIARDTIFRIYSMTKPLTSVAMMQLYEQGLFQLDDPVKKFIPKWKNLQVFSNGDADSFSVTPPSRLMTIRDLFTHTSGFTYDFMQSHPVDELYRRSGIIGASFDTSLEEKVEIMASLPLQFSPGTRWNYSVSTDALGYLVQLLSEQPLDRYIDHHITQPLGMVDTAFNITTDKLDRFAACYMVNPESGGYEIEDTPETSRFLKKPAFISGGGGMVSTIDDYHRFCQTLLNRGTLDGTQLLKPETVSLMTQNQLPDNKDLAQMGQPTFSETPYEHIGFGLGFSVVLDGSKTSQRATTGEFAWGGMASTCFWVDPKNALIVIFMTQLIPSSAVPIRAALRESVYTSLANEN